MTKQQQYNEYLSYGGSMTIGEWENDGRYDRSAELKEENINENNNQFDSIIEKQYQIRIDQNTARIEELESAVQGAREMISERERKIKVLKQALQQIKNLTAEQIMEECMYTAYATNRDQGMKHETLVSFGVGNEPRRIRYENEKTVNNN
jgi:hypothetical protein